tara:strand:+ start:331 stop:639 length:309 start_codon:yes stop_codon:yes gene_type:complete
MKFLETVRGAELEFSTEDKKNKVVVEIKIPEYGHWKRGAYYKISELNAIVVKKLSSRNLSPLAEEGIIHAQQTNSINIELEFKNKQSTYNKSNNTSNKKIIS